MRNLVCGTYNKYCLCGTTDFGEKGPSIDHDHDTDRLRRILCVTCNTGLGALKDSPELMRRGALYVEHFKDLWPAGMSAGLLY